MTYRCTVCRAVGFPDVKLLGTFAHGYCINCKTSRTFTSVDDGEAAKQRGMAAVTTSAGQGVDAAWRAEAAAVARNFPPGREFTIEDIEDAVGRPVAHPNLKGAVLSGLARSGDIEWTGAMRPSSRPERHANLNRVWRRRVAA